MEYVRGLDGQVREIVIDSYVRSFADTHCEYPYALFDHKPEVLPFSLEF